MYRKPPALPLLLALALVAGNVAAAGPRQVNLTTDSAPGWVPSEDLETAARRAASDYMADEDAGRWREAYARLADAHRQHLSFDDYLTISKRLAEKTGVPIERRVTTITWTKDPAHGPAPGIYVALDLVGRFAKADRYCGYLVLYQPPSGGAFGVMREESDILPNDTAKAIGDPAAVEAAWAKASALCPNYAPSPRETSAPPPPIPEAGTSTIGYQDVDAALKGLHAQPGVVFTLQDGWTVATDAAANTFWSFPPPGHPAYPAAVKRWLVDDHGMVSLQMSVLCQASKAACDDLVRAFEDLNRQAAASAGGAQR